MPRLERAGGSAPPPTTGIRQTKWGQAVQVPPRGLIVVSWSEIDTARQCDYKHDLAYLERWSKDSRPGGALARGTLWHAVLEEHYKVLASTQGTAPGDKPEWSDTKRLALSRKAIAKVLFEAEQAATVPAAIEDVELIAWMIEGYLSQYGVDPDWHIVGAEHNAVVRLPNELGKRSRFALKLKIDLIVLTKGGLDKGTGKRNWRMWVVDHKCLEVNTPVPTWRGMTFAGDLRDGDLVLGSDGTWVGVSAVTRSIQPVYRIRLRNGKELTASGDHRWPVDRRIHSGRYLREEWTTAEMIDGMIEGQQLRLIPTQAAHYPTASLPIDPYVLGALLGDGGFTRAASHRYVTFTKHEPTVVQRVLGSISEDTGVSIGKVYPKKTAPNYVLTGDLVDWIKRFDLAGVRGEAKFIPEHYLRSSIQQRRDLLAGLLDTDGSTRKGVPLYQTGSQRLAQDVARLVESLGGAATIWCNQSPKYQHGRGAPNWEVKMRFPREFGNPFDHPDKRERYKASHATLGERLTVVSIEAAGEQECVDIEVTAPDALFVANGVLTHNSGKDLPRDKDFDFLDQFSLYTWAMRRLGRDVFGQLYNAARTFRSVKDKAGTAIDPLDSRFSRILMSRTDIELERVAIEAYQTIAARYRQQREVDKIGGEPPRNPNEQTCQWRCDFTDACLHGRKGGDTRDFLRSTSFRQHFERH